MTSRLPLGPGTVLGPLVVGPLTRSDFVRYAGASGDFNPIHHDEEFARAAGNPTVFGHGMLAAGVLARVLSRVVGYERLRRYRVRFLARIWPGDTLTCQGRVTGRSEAAGEVRIDGELTATNQRGELVVRGEFSAALPA